MRAGELEDIIPHRKSRPLTEDCDPNGSVNPILFPIMNRKKKRSNFIAKYLFIFKLYSLDSHTKTDNVEMF